MEFLKIEDDKAQLLLELRHWLTTSSNEEFSRAAATLSLSASCLFTEHVKSGKLITKIFKSFTMTSNSSINYMDVISHHPCSLLMVFVPASSEA